MTGRGARPRPWDAGEEKRIFAAIRKPPFIAGRFWPTAVNQPSATGRRNWLLPPKSRQRSRMVGMMRLRAAEDLHHAGQRGLRTRAHVQWRCREPHRIDADQRRISLSQAAHAPAALAGQVTAMVVGPRWSSMRIGPVGTVGATGIGNAMKPAGPASGTGVKAAGDAAACTQRRSKLALMPLAIATDATDTPGCLHDCMRAAMSS